MLKQGYGLAWGTIALGCSGWALERLTAARRVGAPPETGARQRGHVMGTAAMAWCMSSAGNPRAHSSAQSSKQVWWKMWRHARRKTGCEDAPHSCRHVEHSSSLSPPAAQAAAPSGSTCGAWAACILAAAASWLLAPRRAATSSTSVRILSSHRATTRSSGSPPGLRAATSWSSADASVQSRAAASTASTTSSPPAAPPSALAR
mmetsp:Transcript_21204/g.50195  ORF Transcript_21204/g.50195 Transcript_21204/m.50195 type:complete len:204 (-) Transcript_21204:133-744(-)